MNVLLHKNRMQPHCCVCMVFEIDQQDNARSRPIMGLFGYVSHDLLQEINGASTGRRRSLSSRRSRSGR